MTIYSHNEELANPSLVGRQLELDVFLNEWEEAANKLKILNVYGTAGIGKSSLLDEFRSLALSKNSVCVTIDGEGFVKTAEDLCLLVLDAIDPQRKTDRTDSQLFHICVQTLNALSERKRVCLFIDGYESMESMDYWLREFFLKKLHSNVTVVIAGRHPLSEAWMLSPVWRRLITRLPLADLDFEAVARYAEYMHVQHPGTVKRLWRISRGHPLTMSLITFLLGQDGSNDSFHDSEEANYDTLAYIVNQWLREVPGEHLRPIIEAACVLRRFNQESLSFVLEREMSASEFYQLIRFSFVRKVDKGWMVHNLMREMTMREFSSRMPQQYEQLRNRALLYFYNALMADSESMRKPREAADLLSYIGDSLVRAFLNWFELSPPRFETATREQLPELEQYIERRYSEAQDRSVEIMDPSSGQRFSFLITADESRYTVRKLDLPALFDLGYDIVRVMRSSAGSIVGFATIIPINEATLPYLKRAPRSQAYFSNLPPAMEERFSVSAHARSGWFIETIDTADLGDVSQQTAMGYLLHELAMTGELVIESPAPTRYFTDAHLSMGFTIAETGRHYNYSESVEAVTFILDQQSEQALSYIHRILKDAGLSHLIPQEKPAHEQEDVFPDAIPLETAKNSNEDRIMARSSLTPREKEVALLLEKGFTNLQIAKSLYLSEITVKKHMKSMMEKLNATNRTQLLKQLLE
ncbi:LuxR family transcriptional regulator [Paenibacillus sp. NEAU-GSW1]|uniref:helix-turn-helix transcriptional regulator n=1 Tax=Paenibacillus sp. NEAU-GSW1 TaxID=2682486 RepID=UPI0012E212C3|nr:LuxR C-terminal-related transcriptional regulator [Paenibacillus sp. NEAU-GSW1]MUT64755.1 AAA family ATPase [Paenibacillus sp. NEAU-GSW1]